MGVAVSQRNGEGRYTERPYLRFAAGLSLIVMMIALSPGQSSTMLLANDTTISDKEWSSRRGTGGGVMQQPQDLGLEAFDPVQKHGKSIRGERVLLLSGEVPPEGHNDKSNKKTSGTFLLQPQDLEPEAVDAIEKDGSSSSRTRETDTPSGSNHSEEEKDKYAKSSKKNGKTKTEGTKNMLPSDETRPEVGGTKKKKKKFFRKKTGGQKLLQPQDLAPKTVNAVDKDGSSNNKITKESPQPSKNDRPEVRNGKSPNSNKEKGSGETKGVVGGGSPWHGDHGDIESSRNNPEADWLWENAGGKFGLSADWHEAVALSDKPGGGEFPGKGEGSSSKNLEGYQGGFTDQIKGKTCLQRKKRNEVQQILDLRTKDAQPESKVAICVCTKDFGRFLPEWVAYHYAIGVDEIAVYDDDSVDDTNNILKPFIEAGIVSYSRVLMKGQNDQMKALNRCLGDYQKRRETDPTAPSWLLFHDTDEYLFPIDQSLSISQALQKEHGNICCLFIKRVQYGSGGHTETPPGLMLENFLTHAAENNVKANRLWKVMVNLNPSSPELGLIEPPLPSIHSAKGGCECHISPISEMRINHYLGSRGDFMDKTRRYAYVQYRTMDIIEERLEDRDINDVKSDAITHWACATREVLARVAGGLDVKTGEPLPGTTK